MTAAAKPDPRRDEAQLASTDPAATVWVAANAGTGKTKVLTDRILRLLLEGVKPSRILCLTFTKAAATEMRLRLAGQLGNWATLDETALAAALGELTDAAPDRALIDRAQGLFARVLDAPGGLPILTIHSFCQSLLKRFPIESGVAPHFQVIEEHHAQELLAQAQQDLLADLGRPDADEKLVGALAEVSALIAESEFDEALKQMIGQRERIAHWIARHCGLDRAIAALAKTLDVAHDDAEQLRVQACADKAFDAQTLRRALPILAIGSDTNKKSAETMAQWLAAPVDQRIANFAAWRAVFLTGTGTIRANLAAKKLAEAHPWLVEAMAAEAERLVALAEAEAAIRLWRATAAMLRLARAVTDRYAGAKRAQARLDFDDQIEAARRLLARPGIAPWVLYKLDGGIDHVLIDEAQDTNAAQWEVVQRLTEEFHAGQGAVERPRTLFVVGDPKQSIFSFQRADPREFARMRELIKKRVEQAKEKFLVKDLVISYRSTQPVLDAVDKVFAQAAARDGLFSDGIVHKVSARRENDGGLVEIWPTVQAAEKADVEVWEVPDAIITSRTPEFRLARAIADHIARAVKQGELLAATGRPIQPGDVLILVRRRNELVGHLVRELKAQGIEVAGIDRMILTEQLAVMDLTALGEFLLQPDDDLALAGVLKSPLIGLDEDQLMALALGRAGITLWAALRARAGEPAYKAAHDYLASLLAQVDFIGPYALYSEILGPRQGRYLLQQRLGHDAADPIDEFLSLTLSYERNETPSLQGFLRWFHAGANEIKRELDQARGQVRIMTVHGSKGLQAPIVYLPDTCQKPDIARDRLLWPDDGSYLLWAARADLLGGAGRAVRDQVKARAEQEYRRLLYVAMTRAADRLYVCGYWNTRKPPEDCWYKLIESGLKDERFQFAFDNSHRIGGEGWSGTGWRFEKKQQAAPQKRPEAVSMPAQALPAWARMAAPAEPSPPRPLAPSRSAADATAELAEPAAFSPLSPEDRGRFKRGLLIHRLLQSLPELPAAARADAAQRFLAQKSHGLEAAQRQELARETLAVLDDEKFAALFGPGSRAEVALAGRLEGRHGPVIVAGQVDRLCLLPDKALIVDYKTNRPPPANVAEVPALYLRQMAAYRALLEQIHPGKPIDCLLLWTAVPRLMELPAALLDAHSP